MIARTPLTAPASPPLTGASRLRRPCPASFSAIERAAAGLMVLMSMNRVASDDRSTWPSSANRTASTSGASGSMVTTKSGSRGRSARSSTTVSPSLRARLREASVRVKAVTSKPAATRFWAIGRPITPKPMKLTTAAIATPSLTVDSRQSEATPEHV